MRRELFDGRRWLLSDQVRRWQQSQPTRGQPSAKPGDAAARRRLPGDRRTPAPPLDPGLAGLEVLSGPVALSPLATLYRMGQGMVASAIGSARPPTAPPRQPGSPPPQPATARRRQPQRPGLRPAAQDPPSGGWGAGRRPARRVSRRRLLLPPGSRRGWGRTGWMTSCWRAGAALRSLRHGHRLRAAGGRHSGPAGDRLPRRRVESQGNYLEVHQFDAHAWVEYLMKMTAGSGSIPRPW